MTKQQEFMQRYDEWLKDERQHLEKREIVAKAEIFDFLNRFGSLKQLEAMDIDDYAFYCRHNDKRPFCYLIDYGTRHGGTIVGKSLGAGGKFCVFRDSSGVLKCHKRNVNPYDAFENIKKEIIRLFTAVKEKNYHEIEQCNLYALLKNKLTYLYDPNSFIPIYASPHLDRLLKYFGINKPITIIQKRMALFDFYKSLNRDDITPFRFMDFIYTDSFYKDIVNPASTKLVVVTRVVETKQHHKKSIDCYAGHNLDADLLDIGDVGEKLVLDYLEEHRQLFDIEGEIRWISKHPEKGIHCDIAYKSKGVDHYVEVKATTVKITNRVHFFISKQEYDFMLKHKDRYTLFYVKNVYSADKPVIKVIDNSIIENNKEVLLFEIDTRIVKEDAI